MIKYNPCRPCCTVDTPFHYSGRLMGCDGQYIGMGTSDIVWKTLADDPIGSTTSDANGFYTIDSSVTLPAGNIHMDITPSNPAFAPFSGPHAVVAVIQLQPASGYHCNTCCPVPLPDTLHTNHGFDLNWVPVLPTGGTPSYGWIGCTYDGQAFPLGLNRVCAIGVTFNQHCVTNPDTGITKCVKHAEETCEADFLSVFFGGPPVGVGPRTLQCNPFMITIDWTHFLGQWLTEDGHLRCPACSFAINEAGIFPYYPTTIITP